MPLTLSFYINFYIISALKCQLSSSYSQIAKDLYILNKNVKDLLWRRKRVMLWEPTILKPRQVAKWFLSEEYWNNFYNPKINEWVCYKNSDRMNIPFEELYLGWNFLRQCQGSFSIQTDISLTALGYFKCDGRYLSERFQQPHHNPFRAKVIDTMKCIW